MYDTILVPTDGSDHAVRAAEHGLYLARLFDATVHLLNVVDVQAAGGIFDAGGVDAAFIERLEAEGEDAIASVEAVADETDALHSEIVRGEPSEAILDYADDHAVDVIAMGTHGRSGVNRYIAGSVTERVVRLAEVPVLTVRAVDETSFAGDYDEILVPTDGSEPAAAAIDHGLAIAEATDARVHAVNVVDVGGIASGSEYAPMSDLRAHLRGAGERATDEIASRAREAGLEAVTDVREGPPARTLLEYVSDREIDLVAMGTAGRTGINRYLLGSTTERVIRHCDVPVLAVNARDRLAD
jgi:nucleotide-binding universal stress UspA family protein